MEPKSIFLLDAFALIYRSYFAFARNPRINSKGENTSATFGFINTLLEVLEKEKPTHIAVVFDTSSPTFRHEEYAEYKANREAMPEGIQECLPKIDLLLQALKIPAIRFPGYEADDIIGTLAWRYADMGHTVYMMTPDKDYAQLVRPQVFMYKPSRMGKGVEIWSEKEVKEKFEVDHPIKVIDFLAMMGDASDNIPGIPGIGEKTAKKLLGLYSSLDGLYDNVDQLKGKQQEKVRENKDQAYLSYSLATICTTVPLEISLDELLHESYDSESLKTLLMDLEFFTIARKLGLQPSTTQVSSPTRAIPDLFGDFESMDQEKEKYPQDAEQKEFSPVESILTEEQLQDMIRFCFMQDTLSLFLHTTSIEFTKARICSITIASKATTFYWRFDLGEDKESLTRLKALLQYPWIRWVSARLKYDIQVLHSYGISLNENNVFDIELAHYILEPDMNHDIFRLSALYLQRSIMVFSDIAKKKSFKDFDASSFPAEDIRAFGVQYAECSLALHDILSTKMKDGNLYAIFQNIEIPLCFALAHMEHNGVQIDPDVLKKQSEILRAEQTTLEQSIYAMAGGESFNIASPKQLGIVLFEQLKLDPKAKKTKTGQYSTAENVLSKLSDKHPIIPQILEYRGITKLLSTYVDSLPLMVRPETGKIHSNFKQTVAATGRLSSTDPNLQNIPIRTENGSKIREAFVPRAKDRVLIAADYSQIELRLIAHMSGDTQMIQAFQDGNDFHASTAAKLYQVPLSEVTKSLRSYAKTVNFGIIYGVSAFGLSEQTDLSRSEAKELIEQYFATYPTLKQYMDDQVALARKQGFVTTLFDRRRILRDIHSRNAVVRAHAERNAVNAPVQGSAADIIKLAMIEVHKHLKKSDLDVKMILQVHDELVFDVAISDAEQWKKECSSLMQNVAQLEVPLIVEAESGNNWKEAH